MCARTLEVLARRGIDKVYVSNLDVGAAARVLGEVEAEVEPSLDAEAGARVDAEAGAQSESRVQADAGVES